MGSEMCIRDSCKIDVSMDVLPAPKKPLSKVTGGTVSSATAVDARRRVRVSLVAGRSARHAPSRRAMATRFIRLCARREPLQPDTAGLQRLGMKRKRRGCSGDSLRHL